MLRSGPISTLNEYVLLVSGVEKFWQGCKGIENTTLDVSSQSGAFDYSSIVTPALNIILS